MKTVAVVGAGPAGCAAAIALSTIGVRCALFECGLPGKDKSCGDAFVPPAVRALNQIGVGETDLDRLGGQPFFAISLHGSTGDPLRVSNGQFAGWVVRRAVIDQHLRAIAARNGNVSYDMTARALEPDSGGIWLHFRGRAAQLFDAVVIATGSGSVLARALQISGDSRIGVALSTYAPTETSLEHLDCYFKASLRPGYGWRFPIRQHSSNVGICLFTNSMGSELRNHADEFARSIGISACGFWRGGSARTWSGKGMLWHRSEGVVSCGDAAGLVDPSTGEGLTAALQSGWEAGRAVGHFVQSGRDVRILESYSAWVREHFTARYARTTARDFWDSWCGLGVGIQSKL